MKRLKIHPPELLVLWIVAGHLVFLPWAIGTMPIWSQFVSLGFAVVGFIFAHLPRNYTEDHTGSTTFRLVRWPRSTFGMFSSQTGLTPKTQRSQSETTQPTATFA